MPGMFEGDCRSIDTEYFGELAMVQQVQDQLPFAAAEIDHALRPMLEQHPGHRTKPPLVQAERPLECVLERCIGHGLTVGIGPIAD